MFNMQEEKKMVARKGGRKSRGMVKANVSLDDCRLELLGEISESWSEIPSVMLRVALHYAREAGTKEFIADNPGCQKGECVYRTFWIDRKTLQYIENVHITTGLSKARIMRAMIDYYILKETIAESLGGNDWEAFESKVADLIYNDKVGA